MSTGQRNPTLAFVLVALLLVWGVWALVSGIVHHDSKDPADYSSCASLASDLGLDRNAECVDVDGHVIKFKDSEYGKRLNYPGTD